MKAFSIVTSLVLALSAVALAQQPSASPKAHQSTAKSSSSANEATGTLVEFVAGQSVVINTGTENQHFKLSGQAQYFNPKGKQIEERKLKKDRKVRVHFTKQGDDNVVDRISLVRDGGHKKAKQSKKSKSSQEQ